MGVIINFLSLSLSLDIYLPSFVQSILSFLSFLKFEFLNDTKSRTQVSNVSDDILQEFDRVMKSKSLFEEE